MDGNKKFKRFITRMNRGLALGLVFGIILVSFVIVDTVKFNKDTEKIREDIVGYITAMAELNGKLESSPVGKAITEEDMAAMTAELGRIFDEYYADPALAEKITVYEGYDRNEVAEELPTWFSRTAGFRLISAEVKSDADSFVISFERQGYSYALVRFSDLPISMELLANRPKDTDIFLGRGPSYLIDPIYPEEADVWELIQTKEIYVSGSVYITLADGEWKILMTDIYTKKETELD